MTKRFLAQLGVLVISLSMTAITFAQTPNTGSMVIVVEDQNGAVVRDAKVSVVNDATSVVDKP